jgi:hypothetical protein
MATLGSTPKSTQGWDDIERQDTGSNPVLTTILFGDYRGIVVCGGGVNECLKEVEIALQALDKPYNVLTQYTY